MPNEDASPFWSTEEIKEMSTRSDKSTTISTCSTITNNQTTRKPSMVERRRSANNESTLPIQGILRKPSIAKRQLSVTSFPPAIERPWWYLWKHGSLAMIPIVGYILSQLFPSSMLLHFTFLCFIYGVVDLMDQDPNFPILSTSMTHDPKTTLCSGTMDQYRLRRVEFVDGTKFYRMPKPMSRKQKQAHREYRFQNAAFAMISKTQGGSGISGVSGISSFDPLGPPCLSIENTITSSPPHQSTTIVDWETTSQRLKSILEPRHIPVDSSRDLDFQDAQQTETTNTNLVDQWSSSSSPWSSASSSSSFSLAEENIDPLKSHTSIASSKFLGGDSVIARLRLATKPLQQFNQQQS